MKKLLNKRNGIIICILTVCLLGGIWIYTSTTGLSVSKAEEIARGYVPESAKWIGNEEDDRYIDVVFFDEKEQVGYEVEVDKHSGMVKTVESELFGEPGAATVKYSVEQAEKIVKNRIEDIKSISALLTQDNNMYEYEVKFKGEGFYGEAEVNAENGKITESIVKYGTATVIPVSDSGEQALIGYEEAEGLVIKEAGGGTVKSIDLDKENQEYFYDVELHKDGMEKDYVVNANTGEVMLEKEHQCYFKDNHINDEEEYSYVAESQESQDNQSDATKEENLITAEEAKSIVFKKLPKGEIIECYLDEDDGIYEYEGEAVLDGYEYEFTINAVSGVITQWEKEKID